MDYFFGYRSVIRVHTMKRSSFFEDDRQAILVFFFHFLFVTVCAIRKGAILVFIFDTSDLLPSPIIAFFNSYMYSIIVQSL